MFAANNTKALVCGVGAYKDAGLVLKHAAKNATDFAASLALKDGCAIPLENIVCLLDKKATRTSILSGIENIATNCSAEHIIFLYFAGHAVLDSGRHYLLPVDTDLDNLPSSAITMNDLESTIRECPARGILFLLDCCHSAGFAEDAVTYFAKPGKQEFRLLVSASKIGQSSIEFDSQDGSIFTRSLVELLRGNKIFGPKPGVLYFSDVFDFLCLEMGEALEAMGQPRALQEPTFAGTYSRDPLLFVLRQLSLEQLQRETPLYSPKFVKARIRMTIGVFIFIFISSLLAYYTYLDHGEYVWHEESILDDKPGDYLAIYRGDPDYNWLSFPHRVVATDVLTNGIDGEIRPGVGKVLSKRFGATVDSALFDSFYPQWQVAAATWSGNLTKALEAAGNLDVLDNIYDSGFPEAAEAIASFATPDQIESLTLLTPDYTAAAKPLLRSIAAQDPDRAIADLNKKEFSLTDEVFTERGIFRSVMDGLPNRCDDKISTFLSSQANFLGSVGGFEETAWHWAALRTSCSFSDDVWRKILMSDMASPSLLDNFLLFNGAAQGPFVSRTREAVLVLEKDLGQQTGMDRYDRSRLLWANLTALTLLEPAALPLGQERFLYAPEGYLRLAAARAILSQSPRRANSLGNLAGRDPWVASALIQIGWYDENTVRAAVAPWLAETETSKAYHGDALTSVLRSMRLANLRAGAPLARDMLRLSPLVEVRIEALRTLSSLEGRSGRLINGQPFDDLLAAAGLDGHRVDLVERRTSNLRPGTWRWFVTHDHNAFVQELSMPAGAIDQRRFSTEGITISEEFLRAWRRDLSVADKRLGAAAALAMAGSKDDLISLLTSSDINLRNTAAHYASYNRALDDSILKEARKIFGSQAAFYISQQIRLRDSIEHQMAELSPLKCRIYLQMIFWDPDQVGPGVRMWLRDRIEALDGVGPDPDDEVLHSNGPLPISPPIGLRP